MIVFPNCKINLGLIITGKRADGYHNIETLFYPVHLNDALEIISATSPGDLSPPLFSHSGTKIEGEEKDNLCIKAWHLLKKDFPRLPAVKMHLHKTIPIGAGLGGGSADGAFTLISLNENYALGLTDDQLLSYALQLGSDCPFFIINKPCIATGRGEILQPVNVQLPGYRMIIVNPRIHINTGWAFSRLSIVTGEFTQNSSPPEPLQTIISGPVSHWKGKLINDFEIPVFKRYPEIKSIKASFYEQGALFAAMSGSGSSVFGIFDNNTLPSFDFPENYLLQNILL
ncbi:MAG: 4-(cytidine 5'-diphospho)-2-C-methyl-D-erythritol kinase [Ferruginibacter sp.]|nr:4-(cytidine 5'-diphospho)-2-C-methyl-D-erythritol kinase [Ferruginibacter sp.]